MKFTEHVDLSEWNGQCLLTVRDFELHDFLDDFFNEKGIETLVVRPPTDPGCYQLLFAPDTTLASVYRLISQIEPAGIERITRINSGAAKTDAGGA